VPAGVLSPPIPPIGLAPRFGAGLALLPEVM